MLRFTTTIRHGEIIMRGLWKPVLISVLVVVFIMGGFALVLLSGGDAGPRLDVG